MIPVQRRRQIALVLLLSIVSLGYGPCSGKQQPETVADILIRLGNVKRDLRARNEITPQQDYDISAKLVEAHLGYKRFIDDELARLSSGGQAPDPSARQAAIRALITSLRGLQDPSVLGIKSANAQKLWRESITTLNTVIAGLEALQGGA
jgi:hypothetical protein